MSACRPCIVIPIYNHKDQIGQTVARLAVHRLPIIIVNDGSDAATHAVLDALATPPNTNASPPVTLLHLPRNGGKGAAVMAGLLAARMAGFSHALQIDADGQHDAADVPHFVAAARAAPGAVIVGRPVYDDSVPAARLYGRLLTNVWVWIETLSLTIRDAMCGYRMYPLAATCALIDTVRLPTRMDFDIEVLVRLYWRRLAFVTVPTRVVYAAGGLSHFDMLWDNVRISRSHTRLVCGMLLRLPVLLAHKVMSRHRDIVPTSDPAHRAGWWRMRERGSGLGLALLAMSQRWLGARVTRWWLHPVVAYFLLTGRVARAASFDYFARLARHTGGTSPVPGWASTYRQMFAFAESGLDKMLAWSGRLPMSRVIFEDTTAFDTLVRSGRGALIIGAHLGNLEMARALSTHGGRARSTGQPVRVTAIVYTEHAKRFNAMLEKADPRFTAQLVQVDDFGPQTAIMMQQRIDAGEWLVIVGDRVPAREGGRTVTVPFLDGGAPFAQGPWVLAHALACPVYLFFSVKSRGRYHLHFESFAERIVLPRTARQTHIATWAGRFADRLANHCRAAPYQWFNFYDFWAGARSPGDNSSDGRS
ncbi:putative LPLAT superfamily acyltransferase [Robbsia andropogonis]|uniref:glycosyltransferase family 2 protein n=1 Tax=Robbsia andropogonis TaxID=28092 RepID=UPI0020A20295|nr:glycosyltransferase family 2 protein [Robbsia andropogonis]MCP1120457.1 glycosyltransferase family 2 protein [Robbsia andropogonis]MCP1130329.1 glycosyltransferase family 2 protein [Robbsia andropogonis]